MGLANLLSASAQYNVNNERFDLILDEHSEFIKVKNIVRLIFVHYEMKTKSSQFYLKFYNHNCYNIYYLLELVLSFSYIASLFLQEFN